MNAINRAVRSEAHKGFIAATETNKGKLHFTRKAVTTAVAMALSALAAEPALAGPASPCPSTVAGTISVTGSVSATCNLATGEALNVTSSGVISVSSTAVKINPGATATSVTNSGTITANNTNGPAAGININSSTVTGDITNNGTISANASGSWAAAINIDTGSTVGNITNYGTLSANGNSSVSTLFVGGNSTVGSITNHGTISASGSGSKVAALLITSGSTVGGITNTGTISGGNNGIHISGISTINNGITNQAGGTISGSADGINVQGSSTINGGISNFGVISGGNSGSSNAGVMIHSSTVDSISNNGTISGNNGVLIQSSGSITGGISNNGKISGNNAGIMLSSSSSVSGGIINDGTISGASGISLYRSGIDQITNNANGHISGNGGGCCSSSRGIGLHSASTVGSITNSGTISGASGIAIWNGSTVTGAITNAASGLIHGSQSAGLSLRSGSTVGSLTNSGTISGNNAGIVISSSSITGGISNSGTISGGTYAINVNSGSTLPTVTNQAGGLIWGGLNLQSTTNVSNAGTLALNANGGHINGDFTQTSTGVVQVHSASPLTVTGTATLDGTLSAILNTGDFALPAFTGASTIAGIVNTGTISGNFTNVTDNSVLYDFTSVVNGNNIDLLAAATSNTCAGAGGTVTSAQAGPCEVGFDAPNLTVTGTGIISGAPVGIQVLGGDYSGTVNVDSGGSVSGSATGVSVSGSAHLNGGIINNGTISGTTHGIYVDRTSSIINNTGTAIYIGSGGSVTGGISNNGTISGSADGINVRGSSTINGGISNFGVISGGNNSSSNAGVMINSSTVDSISNSGTISGASGIAIWNNSTVTGAITNAASGLIDGTQSAGLSLRSGSTIGSLTNSGTISGNNTGIMLNNSSSVSGGIVNNGTISGTNYAGIVMGSNSSITGGISNNGTISGASGISLYGSQVDQITNNANGIISGNGGGCCSGTRGIGLHSASTVGSITNSGTISGASGIAIWNGSTVTGAITNAASGLIHGSQSAGLSLRSGSTVGSLTNSGTISGNNAGIVISSSSITGGISNSGTISGGTYAINVNSGSTLPNIDIVGAAAHLIGDVYAQNTALNITSGANFSSEGAFDVGSFNIANTATFNMAHDVTTQTGFNNSGTLAVAAGTTATINGNYTQAATGVLQTGLAGNATNYGKLVVSGVADLSASNKLAVDVAGTPTLAIGDVMSGVVSAGTLTAGPTYTVTDNSALFNFTAATNGNAIDLTVQRGLTATGSVAKSGKSSAFGAAGVIDTFLSGGASGDMGTVVTALGQLATEQEVANAVGETVPLMTGGLTQVAASNLGGVNRIVESHQDASSGMSSGDGFIENGRGWVKPLGSWARQSDSNAVYGYKAQTYGVVLGADGERGESSRIGAAFAYTNSNVDSNNSAQNAKVDSYQIVLYGDSSLKQNYELNWQADYGYNKNKGSRYISFVNRTASSDYSSSSMHVGTGVGRGMQLNEKTRFIPTIRADYTSITDKAYTETGAGALNLVVNGQTTNEFIIAAGGKVSHSLNDTSSVSANLGVGYDTLAKQNSITAAFQGGGAAFTTVGIKPSSTLVRAGLGYAKSTAGGIEIMLRYDIEARSGFTAQTASAKFRKAF